MKPEVSTPQSGPEQLPVQYGETAEHVSNPTSPETGIETGAERHEQAAESRAAVADATGIPLIMPPPIVQDDVVADVTTVPSSNPVVAGDEDVIEKEWVDKAKKIIADTRDDPYKREKAVAELQDDYLRKRYGREPGAAN
jgi:hypothetical protein